MQFALEAACGTHLGRIRKNNEDNLYFNGRLLRMEHGSTFAPEVKRFSSEGGAYFGVFDGMGGKADGQVASYLSVRVFKQDCKALRAAKTAPSAAFFNQTIAHMNEAVCNNAEQRMNHMGSTAVMMGFYDDMACLCNVGDSRAFRLRENVLKQISLDHLEEIPPFMKNSKRAKPHLSQCIGTPSDEMLLEPYVANGHMYAGDCFLLCSDGLTDMVSTEEICSILSQGNDASLSVQRLIDLALEHGGRDNVTLIVIYVLDSAEEGL